MSDLVLELSRKGQERKPIPKDFYRTRYLFATTPIIIWWPSDRSRFNALPHWLCVFFPTRILCPPLWTITFVDAAYPQLSRAGIYRAKEKWRPKQSKILKAY